MATIIFIIIGCLLVIAGVVVWCVTDWKAIDKYNQQFYENGYHIYYDRKLIAHLKKNNKWGNAPAKNPRIKTV